LAIGVFILGQRRLGMRTIIEYLNSSKRQTFQNVS
jgi:hypothetical protein